MTGRDLPVELPVDPPRTIVVLAKAPVPGRVKTRLTSRLTPEQAADVAAAALADTCEAVAALPGEHVLVLDGVPGPWVPPGFTVLPQRPGGLDRRLAGAFGDVLASHPGPAFLVGMDTPQLGPLLPRVDLAGHDAVLGLAPDGGYWAIGLRAPDPALFLDVPMSVPTTGAAQLARLRSHGLSVGLLPQLRDVDEPDDAEAVARAAPGTRFARRWYAAVRAGAVQDGAVQDGTRRIAS
ncbi:TIGR04282 family arsenosugar biosynthesis glycosyltransferase [Isoptericola sp. NPDC055881]